MVQKVSYLIMILLAGTSIFFYYQVRNTRSFSSERILQLETSMEELKEECERRIAQIKYDADQKVAVQGKTPGATGLAESFSQMRDQRQQSRERVFTLVIAALHLDETGVKEFTKVMESFESSKRSMMDRIRADGGTLFDPAYLAEVNVYRKKTLESLQDMLSEAQYETFLDQEFDRMLDLRSR